MPMKTSSANATSQTIGEETPISGASIAFMYSRKGMTKTADIVTKDTRVCRNRYGERALSLVTRKTRIRKAYVLVFQERAQSRLRGTKNCKW